MPGKDTVFTGLPSYQAAGFTVQYHELIGKPVGQAVCRQCQRPIRESIVVHRDSPFDIPCPQSIGFADHSQYLIGIDHRGGNLKHHLSRLNRFGCRRTVRPEQHTLGKRRRVIGLVVRTIRPTVAATIPAYSRRRFERAQTAPLATYYGTGVLYDITVAERRRIGRQMQGVTPIAVTAIFHTERFGFVGVSEPVAGSGQIEGFAPHRIIMYLECYFHKEKMCFISGA